MVDPVDLDDVKEVIPERVVYNPQTLTITIPAGKTLRIETSPQGEDFLSLEAANRTDLVATITVSIREAG